MSLHGDLAKRISSGVPRSGDDMFFSVWYCLSVKNYKDVCCRPVTQEFWFRMSQCFCRNVSHTAGVGEKAGAVLCFHGTLAFVGKIWPFSSVNPGGISQREA